MSSIYPAPNVTGEANGKLDLDKYPEPAIIIEHQKINNHPIHETKPSLKPGIRYAIPTDGIWLPITKLDLTRLNEALFSYSPPIKGFSLGNSF